MNHMWAQEAHSLGQHLLNQCPGSIWQCLCSWDPWGLSSERQRGWRRITQQLMVSSCLKINISQTKLPIIIHESQSVIFPVPDGGNPALPAAQAKTLDFSDFFHTLHPILQEILSLLPSKSIKNPTTSLYLYVATLLQILNISLLDCFNSLSALAPILPPLKSARELPWKWNQIMTNICQKNLPKTFPLTNSETLSPYCGWHGLALVPLWLSPAALSVLTILMVNVINTGDTFPPQGLCMSSFHHRECPSPIHKQSSFSHLLHVSNMTYDIFTKAFSSITI